MKQATARISTHFVAVSANRYEFSSNECARSFVSPKRSSVIRTLYIQLKLM